MDTVMSDPDPSQGLKDVFPQMLEVLASMKFALTEETCFVQWHSPSHWYPVTAPSKV